MANSRPFMDFLREHRGGVTHDELSDALQDLVSSVATEQRGGKLTITFTVSPAAAGGAAVRVSDVIKVSPPSSKKAESIFFITPENNLVRQDPRQHEMVLRDVAERAEPRGIPAGAARGLA